MKKFIYFIIILIILFGGYYFYAQNNKQAKAPENSDKLYRSDGSEIIPKEGQSPSGAPQVEAKLVPSQAPKQSSQTESTYSTGEEMEAPDILVVQVNYDGVKFEQASLDIKVGDIVIFKNNSNSDFWPASASHPSHTDYPEFDSKSAVPAGSKWQFKFTKVGNWKYHNHLNPGVGGIINVASK